VRLRDVYPARGMFKPGEPVRVVLEVEAESAASASLRITVTHLASSVASWIEPIALTPGARTVTLDWPPPDIAPRGYGVEVELLDEVGRRQDAATTAFDVLPAWTTFPRYGFLTDFTPGRGDIAGAVALGVEGLLHRGAHGEVHIRAGIAVGDGVDVDGVDGVGVAFQAGGGNGEHPPQVAAVVYPDHLALGRS